MPAWPWWSALALNAATLLLFGWDKLMARWRRRRVAERTLLLAMLAGGCIGAWCGMRLFRHKTQKASFRRWAIAVTLVNPLWLLVWWSWRAAA